MDELLVAVGKHMMRTVMVPDFRQTTKAIEGLRRAIIETADAVEGLGLAWDALPESVKEEVRRLDASP